MAKQFFVILSGGAELDVTVEIGTPRPELSLSRVDTVEPINVEDLEDSDQDLVYREAFERRHAAVG